MAVKAYQNPTETKRDETDRGKPMNLQKPRSGHPCYVITVNLTLQPEGCYMVTCEELPELLTQGDTIEEALNHTVDAFYTTLELYEDVGKSIPKSVESWIPESDVPPFETKTPPTARGQFAPYVFEGRVPHISNELQGRVKEAYSHCD